HRSRGDREARLRRDRALQARAGGRLGARKSPHAVAPRARTGALQHAIARRSAEPLCRVFQRSQPDQYRRGEDRKRDACRSPARRARLFEAFQSHGADHAAESGGHSRRSDEVTLMKHWTKYCAVLLLLLAAPALNLAQESVETPLSKVERKNRVPVSQEVLDAKLQRPIERKLSNRVTGLII